jgi:MOSC domain-containing protein YiiM
VLQVNVAMPEILLDDAGREFRSAVRKRPARGRVEATLDGLAGDGSTHPSHGGPQMKVHAFASEHYPWFSARAGRPLVPPVFGENLTMHGWVEEDVRVGDVVRAGTALLRVTQPTVRCDTLGRSIGVPRLLEWIEERMATGWYLRVVEPGVVGAGDPWELVERGREDLTVARLNRALLREAGDAALMRALAEDDALTAEWRSSLARRAARHAREPAAGASTSATRAEP